MFSSKKHHSYAPYDPKFDRMTLYQSFDEEVLLLTPSSSKLRPTTINLQKKGASTQDAMPPTVWFPRPEGEFVQQARTIIDDASMRHKLSGTYLPAPYHPCILNSETDIVQASVLWLLHPVIKALQMVFPNVECAAEVTIGDCRCDALVTIAGYHIAVIEYKARGNIYHGDFHAGMIPDCSVKNRPNIHDAIAKGKAGTVLQSCMGHNATCLTKQAMAYATKWETRYVALFDWDHLFLWNFAGMDFEPARPTSWAFGTWVGSRRNYRSALLGFILEAYQDKMSPKFRRGMEPPFEPSKKQLETARKQKEDERRQKMTPQQRALQDMYRR